MKAVAPLLERSLRNRSPCPGCGALVPDTDGPTHRYIGASPGCWAVYGEVLAREYSDPLYASAHKLTVDTYAVQHPGMPSPQSIRSVALHLVRLHLVLDRGFGSDEATAAMQRAAARKRDFRWLEPPASRGDWTILDVHAAADPVEHGRRVEQWARCVWEAWAPHQGTARRWAEEADSRRPERLS